MPNAPGVLDQVLSVAQKLPGKAAGDPRERKGVRVLVPSSKARSP